MFLSSSCFFSWTNEQHLFHCLTSALQKVNMVFRGRGWGVPSLPQPGREATHVLRHPAVVRHRHLWLSQLLQVGWASLPAVQVGAALVGVPLRGETRDADRKRSHFYRVHLCFIINVSVWWHGLTSLVSFDWGWASLKGSSGFILHPNSIAVPLFEILFNSHDATTSQTLVVVLNNN